MKQPIDPQAVLFPETPSQTAGPYVHIGLALEVAGLPPRDNEIDNRLAGDDAPGEAIEIQGVVLDGNGQPVDDVLVEVWQADANGEYHTDYRVANAFNGYGRAAPSDASGEWRFYTVKPGAVAHPNGKPMAPHLNIAVFARGINMGLHTRMYFDDESAANDACPLLGQVPPWRRGTMIAERRDGEGKPVYRFVIRLQGDDETVFFDF